MKSAKSGRKNEKLSFDSRFYALLYTVAFALNWIWEMWQMFAFETPGKSRVEILFFCMLATFIDGLVTVGIFRFLLTFSKKIGWFQYLSAAILGALCAVVFEIVAFHFGWWSYSELMPVIPVLGTGLLPFAQLAILVPSAIWLAKKLIGRHSQQRLIHGK